jgi:hypothetical protein
MLANWMDKCKDNYCDNVTEKSLRHSKNLISVKTIAHATEERCFSVRSARIASANNITSGSNVFYSVRAEAL